MHTMASIPTCWVSETASVSNNSQLSSLRFRSLAPPKQVCCNRGQRKLQVRCSTQEEFPTTREKVQNKDLNLPLQSEQKEANMTSGGDVVSPKATKKVLKQAREKFGAAAVARALQEAKRTLGKQGISELAFYSGGAALGILFSGTILASLEVLPLVPETMQIVGLACSALVASNVIQGKRDKFQVSPVKAAIAIVEKGKIQQTKLILPEDLDQGTVTAMEKLARERDMAVNQVEELKRQKIAIETVSLQVAEERETAMSEVTLLKSTVNSMSSRMKGIEEMLDREIGLLKSQNQALETVALQLAQERDAAIKETATLKTISAAEKHALEEVAMQLVQERDNALRELDKLMKDAAAAATPASSGPL